MKRTYSLVLFLFAVVSFTYANTATVTTSGFTFTPDSISLKVGDTLIFNVNTSQHVPVEVDSTTWVHNGNTPLGGGFNFNSGSVNTLKLTAKGIRYYVCDFHHGSGMKGRIFVAAQTPSGIETIPAIVAAPYPNPAVQTIHFIPAIAGEFSYTMTDMQGNTVIQAVDHATGVVSIDVSKMAAGDYILTTVAGVAVSHNRIVVAH